MNAFTFLTENGKFNNSEVMKHAHVLKAYRRITLSEALKQAWFFAKRQQKEYREAEETKANYKPLFPKKNLSLSSLYSDPCGNLAMGYVTK